MSQFEDFNLFLSFSMWYVVPDHKILMQTLFSYNNCQKMYAEKPLHKLIDCSYFKKTILVIGVVRAVKVLTCNSQCS